jgi:hypothetical protein
VEDGRYGAFRHAGFAVDAFFRMDKQDCFTFVEAFDWANCDTVGVLAVETGFGDNVRHGNGPFAQVACWQRYGDVSWQKTGCMWFCGVIAFFSAISRPALLGNWRGNKLRLSL